MAETSNNDALAALEAVVRDHGWLIVHSPTRLRAVLSDVLGAKADDLRGAIDAIVVSAEEGIPEAVRDAGRHGMKTQQPLLVTRMEAWGLTPEWATWAVKGWVTLLPEATVPPPFTEPEVPHVDPDSVPTSEPTVLPERPGALTPLAPEPTTLPDVAPAALPDIAQADPAMTPHTASSTEEPVRAPRGRRRAVVLAVVGALAVVAVVTAAVSLDGSDRTKARNPHATDASSAPPRAAGTEVVFDPRANPGAAPGTFAMADRTGGVQITRLSDVKSFGSGASERRAPDGGRLLAFNLGDWPCALAQDQCTTWTGLSLQVTVDSDVRALPAPPKSAGSVGAYVVAVPRGADASLGWKSGARSQTLSLLTGDPGPDNIVVLARPDRTVALNRTFDLTETSSIPLRYPDGTRRTSVDRKVTVRSATLNYYIDGKRVRGQHPASPRRAYLRIEAGFTRLGSKEEFAFPISELRLRDGAGVVHQAIDLDKRPKYTLAVFEVPGGLRRGTLLFGGQEQVSSAGTTYTLTLQSSSVPVAFGQ